MIYYNNASRILKKLLSIAVTYLVVISVKMLIFYGNVTLIHVTSPSTGIEVMPVHVIYPCCPYVRSSLI